MLNLMSDYVAIKTIEQETKVGSIIVPNKEFQINKGEVVHKSTGCETVEVGDVVYFSFRVGQEFEYGDDTLLAMHEDELFGYERTA